VDIRLLDDGLTKAAIVTLDLLACRANMVQQLRAAITDATGTPAANILVATSHNHSGAGWDEKLFAEPRCADRRLASSCTTSVVRADPSLIP
jgi:hypothetical protein